MSEEDELEKLRAKRLAEMQNNISFQKKQEELRVELEEKQASIPTPREILVKRLGYRGLEVLEAAETQFPDQTSLIVSKLAELLVSGEINEELDGGKLMTLFRSVGLHVRVKTTINVEKDGKFVSLSDKLRAKTDEDHTEI